MTMYFMLCNINWWDFDPTTIQSEAKKISGGTCHRISGIYDLFVSFGENDKTKASIKLDKLRKIAGINHTMTLIGIEQNDRYNQI